MIFLSLKTYPEATGDNAIKLSSIVKRVTQETGVPIFPAAQATDIYRIKQELGIEVWAQHIDPIDPGRHFGWISPAAAKQAGASGVIINHAEHPVTPEVIQATLNKAREFGLKTLVLCETMDLARQVSTWRPDFIGYEKGDLIAGPVSMIDQEEANIRQLAGEISQPLIIGAGITTGEHVKKTLAAGGKGVILASAFVKSPDPRAKLMELAAPLAAG